jgi:DNA mismatch repair protein MutH
MNLDSPWTHQGRMDRRNESRELWDRNREEDRFAEITPEELAEAIAQMRRERLDARTGREV